MHLEINVLLGSKLEGVHSSTPSSETKQNTFRQQLTKRYNMPTYNPSYTNFSISFVNGNVVYYNTASTDSQEQDHVKEINQAITFEEAMGF